MKLVSYRHGNKESFGILTKAGIIDLVSKMETQFTDLKSLLAAGGMPLIKEYICCKPDLAESAVEFLPVISNPNKILCIGMNYAEKRVEFDETNLSPTVFIRFADSQTGHKQSIIKPKITNEFDYEGELAVIIGRDTFNVSVEDALDYIAGYSCYMDGSVRDWQHNWFTAGKNWPKTGGFGPCLTTTDEINDPSKLSISTYLNGSMVQHDNTEHLIHSIPEIISYLSSFTPLSAGDVILTGSPGGVGKKRTPPLFLQEGDVVEVEIEKIGCLSNTIH